MVKTTEMKIRNSSLVHNPNFDFVVADADSPFGDSLLDENSPYQRFILGEGNAMDLPFSDCTFDVVIMNTVLFFVPDR